MLDLRSILVRAEAALRDAADPGGAVNEYRAVAKEVERLIFALDQEARRLDEIQARAT